MENQRENSHEERFSARIVPMLNLLYPGHTSEQLARQIFALLEGDVAVPSDTDTARWTENDAILITYADSLRGISGEEPIKTLTRFLDDYLRDTITGVHILPFFPFSSDDGFSVIDYLEVRDDLGTWEDVRHIANKYQLMVDAVLNHISAQSLWFKQFQRNEAPGNAYFVVVDPATDLSGITRPRSTPLLRPTETPSGTRHVWATFSADQVDLNFENPDVLFEWIKILLHYIRVGARIIRLDAIAYLWKQPETSCIHLQQTHEVVKLLRVILEWVNPDVSIITETNVPNRENLSYFGNRNEAHIIYNFSLPPLLVHALIEGTSKYLKTWTMSMPPAPMGCTYLNFTASHDGIGLRPAEGLLSDLEFDRLLTTMQGFGGLISMRRRPDGTDTPYELNISLFDALKGTIAGEDEWQIARFICSQTIMMSLEGIPAFYIHSLIATPNDTEGVERTGHNRSINRHQWDYHTLEQQLEDDASTHSVVMRKLCRLIQLRRQQQAFSPSATQYTLHLGNQIFALWRQSMTREQSIFCVHNVTNKPFTLRLSDLNLVLTDPWYDLISGQDITDMYAELILEPYQSVWITNKF